MSSANRARAVGAEARGAHRIIAEEVGVRWSRLHSPSTSFLLAPGRSVVALELARPVGRHECSGLADLWALIAAPHESQRTALSSARQV